MHSDASLPSKFEGASVFWRLGMLPPNAFTHQVNVLEHLYATRKSSTQLIKYLSCSLVPLDSSVHESFEWFLTFLNCLKFSFSFLSVLKIKGASTLCRAAECNTLQLCCVAKVARHMPPMWSHPHEKIIFCRPSSGYQNCGMRSANLVWFFSQTGWYHFETPYSSYAAWLLLMGPTICRSNF